MIKYHSILVKYQLIFLWSFWVVGSKFVKFLMLILKPQVNSSSDFASFFIVMTRNSSVNFKLKHFLLWIKWSHHRPNFDIFQVLWWRFAIFLMPFSKPHVSFCSNFASFFRVMKDHSSVLFWVKRYILYTKGTSQSEIFDNFKCSGHQFKIHKILVIFEITNQFFFESCIIRHCHKT